MECGPDIQVRQEKTKKVPFSHPDLMAQLDTPVEIICDHKMLAVILSEAASSLSFKTRLLLCGFNLTRCSVNRSLLAEELQSKIIYCVFPITVDNALYSCLSLIKL